MVRQVPPGLRGGHLAPAVGNFLFLRQRVVHPREQLDRLVENRRQRPRRRFALGAVGIGQQVQRGFQVQRFLFARDVKHQPGHRFVKQPVPGGSAHGRLIMQELLQLIRQLIGPHRPQAVEDRPVASKVGIGHHQPRQMLLVQPVELQAEEHQRGGVIRHLVLRIGHELGALAVHRVLVIAQPRKGHQPPGDDVDRFIGVHAVQHRGCVQRRKLALVARGKIGAGRLQPGHVLRKLRRVGRRVQIRKVPVRQVAQTARGGIGIKDRAGKRQRHGKPLAVVHPM